MKKIRRTIVLLASTLAASVGKCDVFEPDSRVVRSRHTRADGGASLQRALADLKLPEAPSAEQLRAYVFDVLTAEPRPALLSAQAPQVEMLTKVGGDNIGVLIDALRDFSGSAVLPGPREYLEYAIDVRGDPCATRNRFEERHRYGLAQGEMRMAIRARATDPGRPDLREQGGACLGGFGARHGWSPPA